VSSQKLEFILDAKVGDFKKNLTAAKGDISKLISAVKELETGPGAGHKASAELKAANDQAKQLLATLRQIKAEGVKNQSQLPPGQKASVAGGLLQVQAGFQAANPRILNAAQAKAEAAATREQARAQAQAAREAAQAAREQARAQAQAAREEAQAAKAQMQAERAAEMAKRNKMRSMITERYALYDVSRIAQQASTALIGFAEASFQAQAAQQAAFAQITKTQVGIKGSGEALVELKKQLIDLSTTIPFTFQELSNIGMLGAQLGIKTKDIAEFTKVVAQFATITGMSVEETSMGFGKLANLLGLNANQYEALGSAIAATGVSSAATEAQIMSTAGQIAAIGKSAGLSASEIIGLSSAFASLKISPYEARGSLQMTFRTINDSVRTFQSSVGKGNEVLKTFAEISGLTQKQFVDGWSDKNGGSTEVFNKFVKGLTNVNISTALSKLKLDSVYAAKALTSLGNNTKLVFEQIAIAKKEGATGTFLDKSFATQADLLQTKLKELQNSFDALSAAASSNPVLIQILTSWLDLIKRINVGFTHLLNDNGILSGAAGIVMALTAILGIGLSVIAMVAIGAAGFLALKTAIFTAAENSLFASNSFIGMAASLMGITPTAASATVALEEVAVAEETVAVGATAAATAARVLKIALATTGIGIVLLLVGALADGLLSAGDAASTTGKGLDEATASIKKYKEALSASQQEMQDFVNFMLESDNNARALNNSMYDLGQSVQKNGTYFGNLTAAGRANMDSLGSLIGVITKGSTDSQDLANKLYALEQGLIQSGKASKDAIIPIENLLVGLAAEGVTPTITSIADMKAFIEGLKASANGAAATVKTLTQYVSDLGNTLTSAFSKRYGVEAAHDAITSSWIDIKNAVDAAKTSIEDATAALPALMTKQQQLTTKISFISGFGDTQRLRDLKAELASVNAEIISKNKTIADSQAIVNKTLIGNSAAAIDNRAKMRGMITSGNEYLTSLLNSGKTNAFVKTEASRLSKEFVAQGVASGYSKKELEAYLKFFKTDFTTVMDGVSKVSTVTIKVNGLDAAKAAVAEFVASVNTSLSNIKAPDFKAPGASAVGTLANQHVATQVIGKQGLAGEAYSSLSGTQIDASRKGKAIPDTSAIKGFHEVVRHRDAEQKKFASMNPIDQWNWGGVHDALIKKLELQIAGFNTKYGFGYASGGFVSGPGTSKSDSIPARLSNGEFVMSASAVKTYGTGFMNALNQQQPVRSMPSSMAVSGGASSQVVYLSPADRNLLQQAINRPVTLQTTDRIIADSANRGNVKLARRASN